jgi:predicted RNA-binding Zn-ribbon protein involved in translation (DUF1610 family)
MDKAIVKGEWFAVWRCVKCSLALSYHTKMYSHGVCPECGNNSGDTIVDAIQTSARKVYEVRKFWIFKYKKFMYLEYAK